MILTYIHLFLTLLIPQNSIEGTDAEWKYLLDSELSQWDIFMGVPHQTVSLEGYEKGDGRNGTPIGLNKDPLGVFSVDDSGVLKITGECYAGLSTKVEYADYHLSLMFRWGEQKYEPRLKDKRDSGILYHAQEPHGQFWNVWMKSPEMQVQEGDCGDFHPLAGVGMDIRAFKMEEDGKEYWMYDPKGEVYTFQSDGEKKRCRGNKDYELKNGEWNQLELICIGDKAYHIVNGRVVMVLENSVAFDREGNPSPLTGGKIQIQSEGAELYYKEIKIRNVKQLPKQFKKQV